MPLSLHTYIRLCCAVMGFCTKGEDNGAPTLKMEAKYWGEIGYYILTAPGLGGA